VEGYPQPYYVVDIPTGANVAQLKEIIKQRIKRFRDADSDAENLKLFKVISSIPRASESVLALPPSHTRDLSEKKKASVDRIDKIV
jgi:Crinkler effector protein N-terminal domain